MQGAPQWLDIVDPLAPTADDLQLTVGVNQSRHRLIVATSAVRWPIVQRRPPAEQEINPENDFRSTLIAVEIHASARKHGVADEDIFHAMPLPSKTLATTLNRWLVMGPDRAGNLLEVVVLTTVEDAQLVIHAMPMRAKFRRLLES